MLNSNSNLNKNLRNNRIKGKKSLPKISLNLHTMPHSNEYNFYRWIIWGVVILIILLVGVYLLF